MEQFWCYCANRQCHTCQRQVFQLVRCPGCKHWFCPTCVCGLGEMRACKTCALIWLEITMRLTRTPVIEAWLNEVTLPKGSSEVW